MKTPYIIPRSFYAQDTVHVAQNLLGSLLVKTTKQSILAGRIVETEAYCHDTDPASHAHRGKTKRNAAMFGPDGHAYVYVIYGIHFCFNVVAKQPGIAAGAVLIRALEPVHGIEHMLAHRSKKKIKTVTNGPGKLAQALQITTDDTHIDLTTADTLYIAKDSEQVSYPITATPRIGISTAQDKVWRFYITDNSWVSHP